MRTKGFRNILGTIAPDVLKLPTKSREQRLTESMPPVVIEMLERRRMMSVTLNGTTLEVTGTSGADNITVWVDTLASNSIYVFDGSSTHGPYFEDNVSLVKILAGGGNDTISIDRENGGTDTTDALNDVCLIYGEAGSDIVNGGALSDTIYGGTGNDTLSGFGGADLIYGEVDNNILNGGDDNDTLVGDSGTDLLTGGLGNDDMYGGAGNDTFAAGNDNFGADYIDGGAGTSDSLLSSDFRDTVVNVEI
jgi:Ca2+-binding RTX toxin-like protein